MKDEADKQTQELTLDTTPVRRGRGRPSTGQALTPAEKQRKYRERQRSREIELAQQLENALAEIERLKD